jgi:hypothetical protein
MKGPRLCVHAVLALSLAWAPPARARVSAKLDYRRGRGADGCPDETALREGVATRLGYDPFVPGDTRVVRVTMEHGTTWRAVVELREGTGAEGRQELSSRAATCEELASAVMLAVSIAVDPMSARMAPLASVAKPEPLAVAGVAPPAPEPVPPRAPPPSLAGSDAADAWHAQAAVLAFVSFGEVPRTTWGGAIEGSVESRWTSLAIEVRAVAPQQAMAGGGGSVRGWLAVATLAPCIHWRVSFACLLLGVGAFLGQGEGVTHSESDATPYVSAGGRLGIEAGLAPGLRLRVFGDVTTPLTPTTLSVGGIEAFRTPDVAGIFGAGVVHSFL